MAKVKEEHGWVKDLMGVKFTSCDGGGGFFLFFSSLSSFLHAHGRAKAGSWGCGEGKGEGGSGQWHWIHKSWSRGGEMVRNVG